LPIIDLRLTTTSAVTSFVFNSLSCNQILNFDLFSFLGIVVSIAHYINIDCIVIIIYYTIN
ncbi:MAG: hypothetical protein OEY79_03305, partial [Anaplasmataceae bacterium]|nr:hypothetical protein [Anaplasmataceae bacterium]